MSTLSRTIPTKKSLTRVPSLGSSFTSCFGASAPVSPRHEGSHGLLAGQAGMNYRKLGFDEDEDEDEDEDGDDSEYEEGGKSEEDVFTETQGPHLKLAPHPSSKDKAKKALHYASEGEGEYARERKCGFRLGKQGTMREKPRTGMWFASETPKEGDLYYVSEGDGYARERRDDEYARKGVMQLGKQGSMREKSKVVMCHEAETPKKKEEYTVSEEEGDEYGRERKGIMKLGKQWAKREKAEVCDVASPRRVSLTKKASFGARVREACVQVLETARRSSPHLSELFVGNQLLMQVTSSSSFNARHGKSVAPSAGFLVTGDPSLSTMSPPSHSSPSAC